MYSRIFEVLLSKAEELGAQLDPAKFFWDFETNLIPAIQGNFPNIRVQGCFFHFCQTVLRQVGRLGIRTDYMNNQEIRRKTLAFLPVNLVPAGFEIINVGTSSQLEALFRYFQREWLQTNKISLWNVHGVSMRINNHMEGWHNRMTKRARKHAPPGFLQLIIDEQGKTETMVQQMDDDYTREMDFVRRSAAYGVQQATASLSYIFTSLVVKSGNVSVQNSLLISITKASLLCEQGNTNMYTYLKPYSKAARHKSFLNTCSSLSKNPRSNKALLLVRKQRLRNASCTPCFSQWKTME
ncbi:hypothetical protein T12_64 [Trichinella patagoniensis]|uniref:MULE transposase domain-containing protein n=1 Tax=Trichinella patagoniensis TaxID=990121 RepID=A0A0V0Z6F5_9BILA|nr:hypothetical protein T12_64 [Trichinella patagoniensis]